MQLLMYFPSFISHMAVKHHLLMCLGERYKIIHKMRVRNQWRHFSGQKTGRQFLIDIHLFRRSSPSTLIFSQKLNLSN